mmetsp:Transcript_42058/g.70176  ORF Transcript_42058/g.70176 Transcript_42058/m.70176 type:complete len:252 (+) Transcript_42058:564-1319(+)
MTNCCSRTMPYFWELCIVSQFFRNWYMCVVGNCMLPLPYYLPAWKSASACFAFAFAWKSASACCAALLMASCCSRTVLYDDANGFSGACCFSSSSSSSSSSPLHTCPATCPATCPTTWPSTPVATSAATGASVFDMVLAEWAADFAPCHMADTNASVIARFSFLYLPGAFSGLCTPPPSLVPAAASAPAPDLPHPIPHDEGFATVRSLLPREVKAASRFILDCASAAFANSNSMCCTALRMCNADSAVLSM